MFKIKEVSGTENGLIFPDNEQMSNDEKSDFGSMIFSLGMKVIIGGDCFKLGDSDIQIEVTSTMYQDKQGIEDFKEYERAFAEIVKKALPKMSPKYKDWYRYYLDDFQKNGLVIPCCGRILG